MDTPTFADQVACVERELGMRRRVYPRWVAQGKLNQAAADREIQRMEAVKATILRAEKEFSDRPAGALQTGELFGPAKVRDDERQKVLAAVLAVAGSSTVYRVVEKLQEAGK